MSLASIALLLAGPAVAQSPVDALPDRVVTYRIDPQQSAVRVLVFRGGLLGAFGHNHVISIPLAQDSLEIDFARRTLDLSLQLPVAALIIDDPVARRREGEQFEDAISNDARAGTRDNLLGPRLLDASKHPAIGIRAGPFSGSAPNFLLEAELRTLGIARRIELPLSVRRDGTILTVTGEVALRHADLGLRPFRAALGTLKVRDEMLLRYDIVATEVE